MNTIYDRRYIQEHSMCIPQASTIKVKLEIYIRNECELVGYVFEMSWILFMQF